MAIDEIRKAFESRRTPHLDLKRNEDGSYRYEAAQMAFRDFADGWQAARIAEQPVKCPRCFGTKKDPIMDRRCNRCGGLGEIQQEPPKREYSKATKEEIMDIMLANSTGDAADTLLERFDMRLRS